MTHVAHTNRRSGRPDVQRFGFHRSRIGLWVIGGALVLALASAALLHPVLLWGYNVQRAGMLLDVGLSWPQPRRSDSLPTERDAAATQGALSYLSAAIRWRPEHPHAYRMAGRIYASRQ